VRYPIGAKPAPADAGNGFRDEHSGKRLDHSLTSTTLRHQADRPTTELLPLHPLGELFPPIEGDGFKELVASIKANGLRDPIIVHDGMVLDGRNRQRACQAAGVDCDYQPLPAGQDPLAFVLDKNLNRRHLTNSQRAMVAAKLANLKDGQTKVGAQICAPVSQEDAAEKLKVSRRSVQSATKVKDDAIPEVIQAVERGDVTVSAAAEIAELPKADQRKVVAKGKTAIKTKAKKLRVNKQKRPPVGGAKLSRRFRPWRGQKRRALQMIVIPLPTTSQNSPTLWRRAPLMSINSPSMPSPAPRIAATSRSTPASLHS
jgi:ParB-like chromosome segregation protein Spo0J